jgi:hypothetical protein
VDEILKAHTVLAVRPGVSLTKLRRRYRALARKHHPDVVEQATRMQQIDDAYRTLLRYLVIDEAKPAIPGLKPAQRSVRPHLSREEIQKVVTALETGGPVDDLLGSLDPPLVWSFISEEFGSLALIFVLLLGGLAAVVELAEWLDVPRLVIGAIFVVAILLFHVYLWRRRVARQETKPRLPTPWR